MARIHFLNVKEGDCSIIEHNSGHKTVIDVCNARSVELVQDALMATMAKSERGISGNFQQKKYPVNPISYMNDRGISSIFRYVQTHPDMDHMDGIEALFDEFSPTNFWDTANTKEMRASSWEGSPYRASDWRFYKSLRDTDPDHDPRRLTLYSGARCPYYNQGSDGAGGVTGSTFSRRRRNSLPRRTKLTTTTTPAPTSSSTAQEVAASCSVATRTTRRGAISLSTTRTT